MPILTVGYGLRDADEVTELLQRHGVEYVGDVRSVPFSRRRPDFSREPLERLLRAAGLRYVFLGETLGGHPDDPACYDADGHVDYDLCRTAPSFLAGIERVETAYREGHRLALLCSEARPTDCHRSKLLAEMLVERGSAVDAQALHDREAGAVDDREALVGEVVPDAEGDLQVGEADRLDGGRAAANRRPELLGGRPSQAVCQEHPGLDEDMVARDQQLAGAEDLLGPLVAAVAAVRGGVEDRRVDEQRQLTDSTASPM